MEQILLCRDCDTQIGFKTTDSKLELTHSDMLCEKCAVLQIALPDEKNPVEDLNTRVTVLEDKTATLEIKVESISTVAPIGG